jgi:hypothetical protein
LCSASTPAPPHLVDKPFFPLHLSTMKKFPLIQLMVFLCCSLALLTCSFRPAGGAELTTWSALDAELADRIPHQLVNDELLFGYETFAPNKHFADLGSTRDLGLFLEMARQKEACVKLAGFFCVQKYFPDSATVTAMEILLSTNRPPLILSDPLDRFIKQSRKKDVIAALSQVTRSMEYPADNLFILTTLLRADDCYDWFVAHGGTCAAIWDSALLERIYDESSKPKRKPTKSMDDRLFALRKIPGFPRLTYLDYTKLPENGESLMRSIFIDNSIPDIHVMLAVQHHREIAGNINLSELKLSQQREKVIRRALVPPK